MTDIKATPATDEEIALTIQQNQLCSFGHCLHDDLNCDAVHSLHARIAADAEIIKAARQERDSVKDALVEAREKLRAKDEEIERLTGVIMGATGEARATLTANILRHWTIESMAALAAKISNDDCRAELAILRAQVETLREALAKAVELYESYGLVAGRVEGDPLAPGRWANSARATLAATEPKE